jgi:FtsH-binding integral membrane protein
MTPPEGSADRSYHRPAVTDRPEPTTTRDETSATTAPTDTAHPRMPFGIRLFLAYAALILVGIALSMRTVVDQAATMPISPIGVVVMILLAYTIFTMTLVIQRKQAGFGLALVLASLVVPGVLLLAISPVHPATPFFLAAFGLLLFRGLLRPEVRTYLSEA